MIDGTLVGSIWSVVLMALLAEAVRALRDRRVRTREERVSAQIVYGALLDALQATHRGNANPATPVRIPFESYLTRWEREQRALMRTVAASELPTVGLAFERLALLAKREEAGDDLREEIFDSLYTAGQACERARRIVWPLTQSTMQHWRRRAAGQHSRLKRFREHRRVDRMWRAPRGGQIAKRPGRTSRRRSCPSNQRARRMGAGLWAVGGVKAVAKATLRREPSGQH